MIFDIPVRVQPGAGGPRGHERSLRGDLGRVGSAQRPLTHLQELLSVPHRLGLRRPPLSR